MEHKNRLSIFEKVLLFITIILIIINTLIVFNVIHVHKSISNLILILIMLILSYTYFKRQNKVIGSIFIIIALVFLISFLITLM